MVPGEDREKFWVYFGPINEKVVGTGQDQIFGDEQPRPYIVCSLQKHDVFMERLRHLWEWDLLWLRAVYVDLIYIFLVVALLQFFKVWILAAQGLSVGVDQYITTCVLNLNIDVAGINLAIIDGHTLLRR